MILGDPPCDPPTPPQCCKNFVTQTIARSKKAKMQSDRMDPLGHLQNDRTEWPNDRTVWPSDRTEM